MRVILKLLAIFVILLGAFTIQSGVAFADKETLRFATMNLEPYGFAEGEGGRLGMFQKLHAAIAQKANFQFTDTVMPIKRVIKQIRRGTSDCGTILRTTWMEEQLDQIAEIKPKFESIIVTRSGFNIKDEKDLDGHVVAIPTGSFTGYHIESSTAIVRHFTNGYAHSARLLKAGRVDAIAGSAVSLIYNMRQLNISSDDIGGVLIFDETPLWLHCTKGALSDNEIKRLRNAVASLQANGFINRLFSIHLASKFD
jgi:polar amino acid transport system substrate-binding protein